MRAIRFVTASRAGGAEFRHRPICESLGGRYDLYARLDNSDGLSKVYNLFLDGRYDAFTHEGPRPGEHDESDIVVFIHDDVQMLGNNVESELNKWADRGYSVMGLAGGKAPILARPALWHLMTPPNQRSGTSVFQYHHPSPDGGVVEQREFPFSVRFGPLRDVDVLDGLFLAVVADRVRDAGIRFDEEFDFHHYDLSFCLRARRAGLQLRTLFVPVIHGSVGLFDLKDPAFVASEARFLAKYG